MQPRSFFETGDPEAKPSPPPEPESEPESEEMPEGDETDELYALAVQANKGTITWDEAIEQMRSIRGSPKRKWFNRRKATPETTVGGQQEE